MHWIVWNKIVNFVLHFFSLFDLCQSCKSVVKNCCCLESWPSEAPPRLCSFSFFFGEQIMNSRKKVTLHGRPGLLLKKNSLKKEGVTAGYILRCWPENLLVFLRCVQLSCPFSRYYRNYYSALSYFYPLPCLVDVTQKINEWEC